MSQTAKYRSIAAATLLTGLIILMTVPRLTLILQNGKGETVFCRQVRKGEHYTVTFIHSVERRPIDETYEIGDGTSILTETVFDMMGAGIATAPEKQQTFHSGNNLYKISGFNRPIPALTYRINAVIADHTLKIGKKSYHLKELVSAPGKPLTFLVRKTPLYKYLIFSLFKNPRGENNDQHR